jgi:hypothetical protein
MLGLELDFVGQLCLFKQPLGYANAAGVADANDAGPGNHVTTL